MKLNKTLFLSVASLLILSVIAFVLVRRRGRKVYLSGEYRLNDNEFVYLYDKTLSDSNRVFYKGTLDYVILPYNYRKLAIGGQDAYGNVAVTYYPVKAIGYLQPNGKIVKVNFKDYAYVNPAYLEL